MSIAPAAELKISLARSLFDNKLFSIDNTRATKDGARSSLQTPYAHACIKIKNYKADYQLIVYEDDHSLNLDYMDLPLYSLKHWRFNGIDDVYYSCKVSELIEGVEYFNSVLKIAGIRVKRRAMHSNTVFSAESKSFKMSYDILKKTISMFYYPTYNGKNCFTEPLVFCLNKDEISLDQIKEKVKQIKKEKELMDSELEFAVATKISEAIIRQKVLHVR